MMNVKRSVCRVLFGQLLGHEHDQSWLVGNGQKKQCMQHR